MEDHIKRYNYVFAYILMCFTVLLGFAYIGKAFSEAFRREVELPDRVHYFFRYFAIETSDYLKYIAA